MPAKSNAKSSIKSFNKGLQQIRVASGNDMYSWIKIDDMTALIQLIKTISLYCMDGKIVINLKKNINGMQIICGNGTNMFIPSSQTQIASTERFSVDMLSFQKLFYLLDDDTIIGKEVVMGFTSPDAIFDDTVSKMLGGSPKVLCGSCNSKLSLRINDEDKFIYSVRTILCEKILTESHDDDNGSEQIYDITLDVPIKFILSELKYAIDTNREHFMIHINRKEKDSQYIKITQGNDQETVIKKMYKEKSNFQTYFSSKLTDTYTFDMKIYVKNIKFLIDFNSMSHITFATKLSADGNSDDIGNGIDIIVEEIDKYKFTIIRHRNMDPVYN